MASCTYSVPNMNTSGDNLYGPHICYQPFIDYAWNVYGFSGNKNYWDDGFGWHDPCNSTKPLARAFNACWLLTYSANDYTNDSWSSPILNWGRRYVRNNIDDLRAKCGDGSAIAASFSGFFVNDRVELYLGFFYSKDVPGRAETLLHESRHQGGKSHNANFPSGSVFGSGSGADSSWGYNGAWMYGALYLWWFFAAGARTTSAMRQRARQRGNLVIDNAFASHPGYSI
ncbi:hypothetical protein Ping_3320 [Psychromonas ingrahamii 37]|uniref:Uncharacterized protein n=1 Tax=Psychromonas ingrahamii (strain DSM 17664 / CCUG 51855 / 37) TaxID=357804 RepID=A1SZU2_PSYIN|nr:hypothetical protein [Psychromonas ingrahamii]ABM05007.1 hypothetical protein Ping_3320 [Psychromonas ingrahamii 37]